LLITINPLFSCTQITNEIGGLDYPYYWTSTTLASAIAGGNAVYIAFGRAAGWLMGMPGQRGGPGRGGPGRGGPPGGSGIGVLGMGPQANDTVSYHYTDVHGAGAQRSDPKTGNPADFPYGRGPQGDVIRINNFVRLVRGGLKGETP
jgi:hypothetical protein